MSAILDKRKPKVGNGGVIAAFALLAGICGPSSLWAQSTIALQGLWRVEGTPLGTERALEPYFSLTSERLFISGSIETEGNRRQVIQVFDAATGGYLQTIEDPTGAVFDGLGDVIAANTDFMVSSTFREAPGALQVFDAATGEHLRGIDNPRADDSTFFGQLPIALSGDRAMAGVALSDDNQSTVWIFDLRTGETLVTIQEPDNKAGFFTDAERTIFGFDKVLTETHALISARNKSLGDDSNVGAVYLFDAQSGDLVRTFLPPDPVADLFFGTDILLADDTVFVTALRETGPLDWPVYEISAFDLNSGVLKYTLQDPYVPETPEEVVGGQQGSGFAFDFAASNGLLFVGLPDLSGLDKDAVGGLHIYDVETGERVFSFENLAGVAGDNLGYGLAAMGDRLGIVSTPQTIENQFSELTRFDLFDVNQGQR